MSLDQNPQNLEVLLPKTLNLADYEILQTLGAGLSQNLIDRLFWKGSSF